MFLNKIQLANFKNYAELETTFSPKINCLIGNNGTGKTNLLDAIYYLSFCKSYFNILDSQNIKHEEAFFAIHGDYIDSPDSPTIKISCIQKRGQNKQVKFEKKAYERLSEHIGKIPLVIISPYDQDLINDGSDVRRKFLDGVISQTSKTYLDDLLNYQRVLFQRNKLLKLFAENRHFDEAAIEIWDEQLVRFGMPVYEQRKAFLFDFTKIFLNYFEIISAGKESVDIVYNSSFNENDFKQSLINTQRKDAALQYTSIGIHKDDLVFKVNDYPCKKFASQGQQKSFVLALKLAQFEYMANLTGVKPILLLDDIFDKLDLFRVKQLLDLVGSDRFGQVFLTDTQQGRVQSLFADTTIDHKIFSVADNQLKL